MENPIIAAVAAALQSNRKLVGVHPRPDSSPRGYVLYFAEGPDQEEELDIDREGFLRLWHQASVWKDIHWHPLPDAD